MTDTNPRDLIKRLADALHDAADDVRGWGDYASSYFQEKHDLRGNVARIYAEVAEAYAYLDQPKLEGPTDEELEATARAAEIQYSKEHGGLAATTSDGIYAQLQAQRLAGLRAVAARWGRPAIEPEAIITEPRGCPTPGACSCPAAPFVPPELIRALELAEAALARIGDAEREPGDDLAWAEARAAQDLPRIRRVLALWGK
jgi:hypothetical protein